MGLSFRNAKIAAQRDRALIAWVSGIGPWAYLAIFLVVSLESAAFLGFFMPSEAMVFLGGFLASQGALELRWLIPLVAMAAILGDSIGYELGRLLGKPWFLRYGGRLAAGRRTLE